MQNSSAIVERLYTYLHCNLFKQYKNNCQFHIMSKSEKRQKFRYGFCLTTEINTYKGFFPQMRSQSRKTALITND